MQRDDNEESSGVKDNRDEKWRTHSWGDFERRPQRTGGVVLVAYCTKCKIETLVQHHRDLESVTVVWYPYKGSNGWVHPNDTNPLPTCKEWIMKKALE